MGIKSLNNLIKKYAPESLVDIPIEKFRGTRIAIDANWLFRKNMHGARCMVIDRIDITSDEIPSDIIRDKWGMLLVNFIIKLLEYGITPVFVFDGVFPEEKGKTQKKRSEKRNNLKNEIDEFYTELENGCSLNVDDIKKIKNKLKNYNHITEENYIYALGLLKGLGIPFIYAKCEGEKLCSMLCIEGKVSAVYSADTDNIAYGCPILINKFNDKKKVVSCVLYKKLINALNMSKESFLDLCIMLGCDYNKNIKNYGVVKSYNAIKEHGSIDNLPSNLDTSCLVYSKCRQLFNQEHSVDIYQTEYSTSLNNLVISNTNLDILSKNYGFTHLTSKIKKNLEKLPIPSDNMSVLSPSSKNPYKI